MPWIYLPLVIISSAATGYWLYTDVSRRAFDRGLKAGKNYLDGDLKMQALTKYRDDWAIETEKKYGVRNIDKDKKESSPNN